jgi:hypothetical protein
MAKMRRAARRVLDPNGQGGGHMPKPIRDPMQTVQNGPDLVQKYVGPLEMPLLLRPDRKAIVACHHELLQ